MKPGLRLLASARSICPTRTKGGRGRCAALPSEFLYDGFTGGLNSIDSPFTIADEESRDCLNVVGTLRGSIVKRNGSTQFLAATPPAVELTGITSVQISGTRYLIAFGGTKVYSIGPTGILTDITGSATITSGSRWCVVQAPTSIAVPGQGPVYMSNGIDPPLQWTGSGNVGAWTGTPSLPNGSFMCFHQNRIWTCGVSGSPSTVFFSDITQSGTIGVADPSSWTATNTAQFDAQDGYPLTGIGDVGPYLVVFKEHKSWVITDPVTAAARQLVHNVGCVSHRSICSTPEGTFFLTATQGVFLTNGTSASEVSYKVRPTIQAYTTGLGQHACASTYGNHYYLSFPWNGSTANNRTLDYDMQTKAWWLHDITANEFAVHEPAGSPYLYAALPGVSKGIARIGVPGVYTDLGVPYAGGPYGFSAYYLGAWQRFYAYFLRHRNPMPMVKKRIRQIYFNGSGVIVPVVFKNFNAQAGTQYPGTVGNADQWNPDMPIRFSPDNQIFGNADTAQTYGGLTYKGIEMLWGGYAAVGDARIYAPGIAEEWSVGFGNSTADPFQVNAYSYATQTRKS